MKLIFLKNDESLRVNIKVLKSKQESETTYNNNNFNNCQMIEFKLLPMLCQLVSLGNFDNRNLD